MKKPIRNESQKASFVGRRVANKGDFFVTFPVDSVFPLYGPVEEARWAPGWEPRWLFPDRASAEASVPEPGWTFTTGKGPREQKLWYLQEADFARHKITYVVHWPGRMVYRIDIEASQSTDKSRRSGTSTTVTYDYVGTSVAGNREVRRRTARPEEYSEEMEHWRRQIQGCLEGAGR